MGSVKMRACLTLVCLTSLVLVACGGSKSGGGLTTQVVSNPSNPSQSHSVVLSWTASTTSTVTNYYVYRSTVSGPPYQLLGSVPAATTTYTDNTVGSGQTYYYVITAVDQNATQSDYSNEVKAPVPSP